MLSIFHFIDKKNVNVITCRWPIYGIGDGVSAVSKTFTDGNIYIYRNIGKLSSIFFSSLFHSNRKRETGRKNDGIIISFYKGKKKTRTSKKKKKRKIASIVLINRMKTFAYEYRYLRVNRISDSINKNRVMKNDT